MGAILQQASQLQRTRGLLILLCVVRLQGSRGPLEIRSNASVHVSFFKRERIYSFPPPPTQICKQVYAHLPLRIP